MPAVDVAEAAQRLRLPPRPGTFTDDDLVELPAPVQRYLRAAIAPGTPHARAAELTMEGHMRLGRWVPFRASETLAPGHGFVWPARAMGVVTGADGCVDGVGGMDWALLGRVPVMHAEGPDVSRSAADRAAAEAVWVPTTLLPGAGTEWRALDHSHLVARVPAGDHHVELHLHVDPDDGRVLRVHLQRWGDPDETGTWGPVAFGGDVTDWSTFDGVTVPSAGRMGWWYGTPRFGLDGEFFRYRLTDLRLVR